MSGKRGADAMAKERQIIWQKRGRWKGKREADDRAKETWRHAHEEAGVQGLVVRAEGPRGGARGLGGTSPWH
jgi:hypothetical protein